MADAPDVFDLTPPQARVLGVLLEKEATTPDSYPLTLNALTTGCNQSTNRDPVVEFQPSQVETTLMALKSRGLVRIVHPGSGERATKYRHVADEALVLGSDEQAVLCVLLLRGAQTLSELKTRTERLHAFAGIGEVEAALKALAGREPPFVARVEQVSGQREARWIQLLESGAERRAAAPSAAVVVPTAREAGRIEELEERIASLESRLAALSDALGGLVDGDG